jgi:hypothetical protein
MNDRTGNGPESKITEVKLLFENLPRETEGAT